MILDTVLFDAAYERFRKQVHRLSRYPFVSFNEGMPAFEEGYKPRIRKRALEQLKPETWDEDRIGQGEILEAAISSIELPPMGSDRNNLVFWENRFGHANRDHRALLEARSDKPLRRDIERALFDLFRGEGSDGRTFERLAELSGRKFPLVAYLFFLRDGERFLPISPTGFDRAFAELGLGLKVRGRCDWDGYSDFLAAIVAVQAALQAKLPGDDVALIDAHSFCWMLATMPVEETVSGNGTLARGVILGDREVSITMMRMSVQQTVKHSNGQIVERRLKDKELRLNPEALTNYIRELLDLQENRCALTGLPLRFGGRDPNNPYLPSLDRKDSDGHYELGNLQVVCKFVQFWKGSSPDEEFRELLQAVRSV